MTLTCVTAVYNAFSSGNRERLIRCVKSVAKIGVDHEHLVYDGSSSDGTIELLRELETVIPGLRVISERDSGIYNALNKGVRDARGEWFYVLGCDDYIAQPWTVDALLRNVDSRAQVLVTPVKKETGDGLQDDSDYRRNIFWGMPYCHQGVLMRTEIVRRLNGFDERCKVCGDYSLILKCHLQALDIRYVKDWFAVYFAGGVSSRTDGRIGDSSIVMKDAFGLTDAQLRDINRSFVLPLYKVLRYLFHRDPTLRLGAVCMCARYVKNLFCFKNRGI